ncbi:hypothetical protein C8R45DRAFT_1216459 [Mycena sanguinolenta]|nr:hypothetical protein C8R45DRAFT_1216459 [Mycena sanguinolenta]
MDPGALLSQLSLRYSAPTSHEASSDSGAAKSVSASARIREYVAPTLELPKVLGSESILAFARIREYAAPTLEPRKAAGLNPSDAVLTNPTGRRARSGAEFSPFAMAVAIELADVRLSELLAWQEDSPDSDADSDSEDDPTVPVAPTTPAIPSSVIRVARPGTGPAPPTSNGAIPGSIIRVTRLRPSSPFHASSPSANPSTATSPPAKPQFKRANKSTPHPLRFRKRPLSMMKK